VDRKCLDRGEIDANDPTRTSRVDTISANGTRAKQAQRTGATTTCPRRTIEGIITN